MLNEEIKVLKKKIDEMEWLKKKVRELETTLDEIKHPKSPEVFKCKKCQKVFETKDSLKNHITTNHSTRVKCKLCTKDFQKITIWRFISKLNIKKLKIFSVRSVI